MIIDLAKNPKQEQFFNTAVEAAFGINDYRYLFYGGAIRGGKTFVCLTLLTQLCKWFPKSRWHIFRADFPALQATTIPSMEQKILAGAKNWKWNRDRSNYFVEYVPNGSRIFFRGENITSDPKLNDLLGLETNGIMLEQVEELSEKLWDIGISRIGSWYVDKMPNPLILATFNPTQTWIKKKIYEPHKAGMLNAPYFYLNALPSDNFAVTSEQYAGWELMAERYKKQYIEGDWSDYDNQGNGWAFAYSSTKHTWDCDEDKRLNRAQQVYLSFDFNVNPMTCAVIQHYDRKLKVVEMIKLQDSSTKKICEYIRANYLGCLFSVTGDATGASRNTANMDNMNNYMIIQQELKLGDSQLYIPNANPSIAENKVLVNSILATYNVQIHKTKAEALHYDLANAKIHPDGSLIKGDRTDPTQQLDCLDCMRYFCNVFMGDYLTSPRKYLPQ